MWAKLVEELEPVGFGLATVHSEHEREMSRKIGVKELPHLVPLTDGKVINQSEPSILKHWPIRAQYFEALTNQSPVFRSIGH